MINKMISVAALLLLLGCNGLDPAGPYKGDKVAYGYDLAIATCTDGVEGFLAWEQTHRAVLVKTNPKIVERAKLLHDEYPAWAQSAARLSAAYQANPTSEARATLEKAMRVLRQALLEATQYMLEVSQ